MPFPNNYVQKKISDINPLVDSKLKILGFVVDKKEDTVVLDDGSGKIRVVIDIPGLIEKAGVDKLVRVFGSLVPVEGNNSEIRAEIVQDLSGLDINLYKTTNELYNKYNL